MSFSIFSHLLVTERLRQRGASGAGFSVPAMSERGVPEGLDPVLVTNARCHFVVTRRNLEGLARFGFSKCDLEGEPILLSTLIADMCGLIVERGWSNLSDSVEGAIQLMGSSGVKPKNLVLPRGMLSRFTGSDGVTQGRVDGVQLLSSDLPPGFALLTADAPALGVYVRVGDYVGIQLYNVDKTMVVIDSHELG